MRRLLVASILVGAALLSTGAAKAQSCPSDPGLASQALWPGAAILTGQKKRGKHPCGQTLECVGGSQASRMPRSCRWVR